MTPRSLHPEMIGAKLRLIAQSLDTLHAAGPVTAAQLAGDPLMAAGIERLLSRIVDLAVDVNTHVSAVELGQSPPDYRSSFATAARAGLLDEQLAVELAPSVGLRNALVHTYLDIDVESVVRAVPLALAQYRRYVEQAARWTAARPGAGQ